MPFMTAIQAVIDRLEDWSPVRDPEIKFRRQYKKEMTGPFQDRNFLVLIDTETISNGLEVGDVIRLISNFQLEIFYSKETDSTYALEKVVSDQEEVYQRLIYTPGNEYAKTDNVDVEVTGLSTAEDDRQIRLIVDLRVTYNL